VLRGASSHILEEADRSLHDALCVLSETVKEPRVLYGGGWPEMRMARAIEEAAKKTPGAQMSINVIGCVVGAGLNFSGDMLVEELFW
jgi:chaperonin GroEL (HSP60 family)